MFSAVIAANAVNRQFVVAVVANSLVTGTAQNFNNIAHTKALPGTINAGEGFLRLHQTIVTAWRIEADITVVALLLTPPRQNS